jgi:IMP cyclohydrolase
MANPAGNYPGRQIFLGTLATGEPAFAYFGSGRSAGSQKRYASPFIEGENAVRIKPVDPKEKFDPFRHYQAVKINPETGLVVLSNSQAPVDAVYEYYWLAPKVGREDNLYLQHLLEAIGPEYDSKDKPTSRILGVKFRNPLFMRGWESHLGITDQMYRGSQVAFDENPGLFYFVPTYDGKVEYANFDRNNLGVDAVELDATTAQELADEIYESSDYADLKYGELRVWCVAGVQNGNGPGGWEIARRNRFSIE